MSAPDGVSVTGLLVWLMLGGGLALMVGAVVRR